MRGGLAKARVARDATHRIAVLVQQTLGESRGTAHAFDQFLMGRVVPSQPKMPSMKMRIRFLYGIMHKYRRTWRRKAGKNE